ncbi:MAG: hypothetical protein N2323_03950 [candidate division WOR-3 bacterium]|nr:hypothetical protein [candidate division WOR-3 bacterium]MDW8114470.1 hypothetical protein [candidate division WOR-3 bacterium]
MNGLFILLIFQQLSYFEFVEYPEEYTAGDSFLIKIVAFESDGDTCWYFNDMANLATTKDGRFRSVFIYPNQVYFQRGIATQKVMVTLAEELSLMVYLPNRPEIRGITEPIEFYPNYPKRLIILSPVETLASGSSFGKISSFPFSIKAGENLSFRVYITDNWFNPTKVTGETCYLKSTDSFAFLPQWMPFLGNESLIFNCNFKTANKQKIYVLSKTGNLISDSTEVIILPNVYNKILLLLPGEEIRKGDTSTLTFLKPGKRKLPNPQYVKESFLVKVYICDTFYNPTNCNGETIRLFSDYSFSYSPDFIVINDSGSFVCAFDSIGENQTIWAKGRYKETYRSKLNILPKTKYFEIFKPDTLLAGKEGEIEVVCLDTNKKPIPFHKVIYKVIKGNGILSDTLSYTDEFGVSRVRFVCYYPNFGEFDTILIKSDDKKEKIGIYIEAKDTAILKGKIIGFPNPTGIEIDSMILMYYLPQDCDINLFIYDPFGNIILERKIKKNEIGAQRGVNYFIWNCRDKNNRKVPNGLYNIRITGISHTKKVFDNTYRILVVW